MKRIIFLIFLLPFAAQAGPDAKRTDAITRIGDIGQFAIPFSALVYSMAIQDWQGVGQLGLSTGAAMGTTYVLKYTVREERPYQPEDSKGQTFPSGHTAMAFSGAGFWQRRYGWAVGAPMYLAASFVGYSRVHSNMHYSQDVIAGAAIGIGFNYLFTTRYNDAGRNISISPTDGGAMLRFNTIF
ncbi:MAG: phosphatase PAP2 family protein [Alphaproteobacteria bacterium]|nr:phosphatase PAP2 family protein [Alphaproteobacteria bacterium]